MLRLTKLSRLHVPDFCLLDGCWQQAGMLPGSDMLLLRLLPFFFFFFRHKQHSFLESTLSMRMQISQPGALSDKGKRMESLGWVWGGVGWGGVDCCQTSANACRVLVGWGGVGVDLHVLTTG